MSNLPGNPHHALSEAAQTEHVAQVHATLALAYEQRTANLIAVATAVTGDGVYLLDPDIVQSAQWELYERLGIEASK